MLGPPPSQMTLWIRPCLLFILAVACTLPARAKSPPNIVLFLVDDLGWSDVACYGSRFYETPNVDRLAEGGMRFTQAYAACHVCSPTRASLLTGKYPARLALTDWLPGRKEHPFEALRSAEKASHLPLSELTIAEALKRNGYTTGIFGKWHLGDDPTGPLQQGFDVQVPRWNGCCPRGGYHPPSRMEGIELAPGEYLTDRLTDEALDFIEENQSAPFFLYLSHFSVHDPIQGRADLVAKYQRKLETQPRRHRPPFLLEGNPDDSPPLTRQALASLAEQPTHQGHRVLPRRTVKIKQHQDNVQFAAMVDATDESLGRVVAKLDSLGLTENTIVIFYSDNGGMSAANFGNPKRVITTQLDRAYSTSNLPLRGAKGWLYEGGIRVPLILKWPGHIQSAAICDQPVISPDIYPTLLELLGIQSLPQQHQDGVSFSAALRGESFHRGAIYWHFPHYSNHGMQSPAGAIRGGDWKLIEYFENNSVQLFNLAQDPGETANVASQEAELAEKLRDRLHAWRQEVGAKMPSPK